MASPQSSPEITITNGGNSVKFALSLTGIEYNTVGARCTVEKSGSTNTEYGIILNPKREKSGGETAGGAPRALTNN
jgi:hypothetical protein